MFRKGKRSLTLSVPQIMRVDRRSPPFVHRCFLHFLLIFWGCYLIFPRNLGSVHDTLQYFAELPFSKVPLSILRCGSHPSQQLNFLHLKSDFWLVYGWTITLPSFMFFSSILSRVYHSLYLTPSGSIWQCLESVGFHLKLGWPCHGSCITFLKFWPFLEIPTEASKSSRSVEFFTPFIWRRPSWALHLPWDPPHGVLALWVRLLCTGSPLEKIPTNTY